LSRATAQPEATLTHKLMGNWQADQTSWDALIVANDPNSDTSRPYPFYLAHPLADLAILGAPKDWQAEYKWDGIRAQLIARGGNAYIWSRGQDLITAQFPELAALSDALPDGTVIDGEILAFADGRPLPFGQLQKRIGRKTVSRKLRDDVPVILMAYDLLEHQGQDLRPAPLLQRRALLGDLVARVLTRAPLQLSRDLAFETWDDLARLRAGAHDIGAEGLMLKRATSPYLAGRKTGDWWKWKRDPLTIDAVMVYAQAGHGRRANLFTDYTFAVRDGDSYVPFTKAYSGLTDAEFQQITTWVRKNTVQKFGPVRQVPPALVFEIGFEGISASPRHKSGIALRFPRMLRWRHDKPLAEINTLTDLQEMLQLYG
jgi:DNA ligase 1